MSVISLKETHNRLQPIAAELEKMQIAFSELGMEGPAEKLGAQVAALKAEIFRIRPKEPVNPRFI